MSKPYQLKKIFFDEKEKKYVIDVLVDNENIVVYANAQGDIIDVDGKIDLLFLRKYPELSTDIKVTVQDFNSTVTKSLRNEKAISAVHREGAAVSDDPIVVSLVKNSVDLFNTRLADEALSGIVVADVRAKDKLNEKISRLSFEESDKALAVMQTALVYIGDLDRAIAIRAMVNMTDEAFFDAVRRIRGTRNVERFYSQVERNHVAISEGF